MGATSIARRFGRGRGGITELGKSGIAGVVASGDYRNYDCARSFLMGLNMRAETVATRLKGHPAAYRTARAVYRSWRSIQAMLPARIAERAEDAPVPPLSFPQACPHFVEADADKGEVFRSAWEAYARAPAVPGDPVALDPVRIVHLFNLVSAANKLPEGDYIELGTHRGFTLRAIHKFMDPTRMLYALDTFEGFDQRDIDAESRLWDHGWKAGSFLPTSADSVARYVGDGVLPTNLKTVPGWFPDSFKGLEDRRWRFVHIDFDLYQPIKTAMEILWEPLLPGGVMMVHDYGCYGFPMARKAVDEFCAKAKILPIELADRWGTAALRKPILNQPRGA